jgi:hypothetical protein
MTCLLCLISSSRPFLWRVVETHLPACPKFSDSVTVTIYLNPFGSTSTIFCLTR